MIRVGDKVKINFEEISEESFDGSFKQMFAYIYMINNPEEIYCVSSINADAIAKIVLDHPILKETSFFEVELIKLGGNS